MPVAPRASSTGVPGSGIQLQPDIPICQTDLPLDWYQAEFKPYAEEYLALPDRLPETVLPWMDGYISRRSRRSATASCCSRTTTWAARS
jgi:hypothetical protein